MVDALVDTDIVVDLLRNYAPALAWQSGTGLQLGVTPVVILEVIDGAGNKLIQNRAMNQLTPFQRVDLTPDDFTWAVNQALVYRLSHNIGYEDCLIASVNHRLQLPLFTRNLKHFTPLLGSLAQAPYA